MYTRRRTKNPFVSIPHHGQRGYYQLFSGTQSFWQSGHLSPVKSNGGPFVVTQDCEVARFHSRRAAGEVFCNPFSSVSEIRMFVDKPMSSQRQEPLYAGESDSAAWKTWYQPDSLRSFGTALSVLQPGPNAFGYDALAVTAMMERNAPQRDVAWNAALADMAKTNALLLVTAAELRKTMEMIGQYALLLRGSLGRMEYLVNSAGKYKQDPRTLARLIANEWLKIRYGVMTTVYEIQGVVEALNGNSKPERVTARGKSAYTDTYLRQVNASPSGFRPELLLTTLTQVQGSVRAGVLFEPLLDSLQSRLGLHPTVLPEVFFELIRLSFVANWFVDLSETIRAVNASFYGKSLCGWITETVTGQTAHTITGGGVSPQTVIVSGVVKPTTWDYVIRPDGARADSFFTIKTRTPVGGLSVKTPSLRVRVSLPRVADAFALIAQTLTGAAKHTRGIRL